MFFDLGCCTAGVILNVRGFCSAFHEFMDLLYNPLEDVTGTLHVRSSLVLSLLFPDDFIRWQCRRVFIGARIVDRLFSMLLFLFII